MTVFRSLDVVCALLERDGHILAARRSDSMAQPGKWEFPGGKIEPDEAADKALVREIREELCCEIMVGDSVAPIDHVYPEFRIRLMPFWCSLESGEPRPVEHAEIRWCTKQVLEDLEWAAADALVVETVLSRQWKS